MERTESIVVQVVPDYENAKIKEMEMFGWNLQGRQEIHEEGEAYGRPSYLDSSTYVIKTKVSHYVKLHFVRSLSLPNLDQIKQIEQEYFNLPFPAPPTFKSFIWPALFVLFGIISLTNSEIEGGIPLFLMFSGLGGWWFYSKIKKRQKNIAICEQSIRGQEKLVNQLQSLF